MMFCLPCYYRILVNPSIISKIRKPTQQVGFTIGLATSKVTTLFMAGALIAPCQLKHCMKRWFFTF